MGLIQRKELYKKIEILRGHPLVVYATSSRPNLSSQMASDVIPFFIEQLENAVGDEIDILLQSRGGDGLLVRRIISYAREKFKKVHILIPYEAFSAATLFSLGGDTVVMGKYANLGPIDPQITTISPDGKTQAFAYEDVVSFIDFVKEGTNSKKAVNNDIINLISKETNPIGLGFARRASYMSQQYAEKLMLLRGIKYKKAKKIAKNMNKNFSNHGHAVSRQEAKDIGLNVVSPDAELEELLWNVHLDFCQEAKENTQFNPIQEFLLDAGVRQGFQQMDGILGMPNEVFQRLFAQGGISGPQFQNNIQRLEKKYLLCILESKNLIYQFCQTFELVGKRELNLSYQIVPTVIKAGREKVE